MKVHYFKINENFVDRSLAKRYGLKESQNQEWYIVEHRVTSSEFRGNLKAAERAFTKTRIIEGEVIPFAPREPYKRVPEKIRELAARWFWAGEDYDRSGTEPQINIERLLKTRGYTIEFDNKEENIIVKHLSGSEYSFPVEDAYNYTGWHQGLFNESKFEFAGEKVGQKPGDQVRGTERAKKSKKQHPFKGRLVGGV